MDLVSNPESSSFIAASSSLAEESIRILKHNESFAVFNRFGNVLSRDRSEQGIYHMGTRFVSHMELLLDGQRPLLLNSSVNEDNATLAIDLMNPDDFRLEGAPIQRGSLHIERMIFLYDNACYEEIRVANYGLKTATFPLQLRFEADFADIFEIRGVARSHRGVSRPPVVAHGAVHFSYVGLDHLTRRTEISSHPLPDQTSASGMEYRCELAPQELRVYEIHYSFYVNDDGERASPRPARHREVYKDAVACIERARADDCRITTSNEQFNVWLQRSLADLHMMQSKTSWGIYPYAGVPWFSAPFGRDGIITALEMLWVNPGMARAVLGFLAHHQAREFSDLHDAEPGKILHEARTGEMANMGEIPFRAYYGSVDSTPLFLILAGAYYRRTGDLEYLRELWPHIEAALGWVKNYGDRDGDGFVEYHKHCVAGLVQQGWKDSEDSIFHADGRLAASPIALCEVQGYVFAAKNSIANVARAMGDTDLADGLIEEAAALRERFAKSFWDQDLGFYALALDREKIPCRVLTSNAGHCLFTGIALPEHAALVAAKLMEPALFSGWGVRTVATGEARYNPMSYHNGSIWPHDNAIVAAGLARYGFKDRASQILSGLFHASRFVDLARMPELFCGFSRIPGRGPTLYPVSCAPQAWSAGAVFMTLGACLGLSMDGQAGRVTFFQPHMPDFLESVQISNLRAGVDGFVDVELVNHGDSVGIKVLNRCGQLEVVLVN